MAWQHSRRELPEITDEGFAIMNHSCHIIRRIDSCDQVKASRAIIGTAIGV